MGASTRPIKTNYLFPYAPFSKTLEGKIFLGENTHLALRRSRAKVVAECCWAHPQCACPCPGKCLARHWRTYCTNKVFSCSISFFDPFPCHFSAGADYRKGVKSPRSAWHVHARMFFALFLLMYLVTAEALPLQWEEIHPIGIAPSARYRHASTTLDSGEGAVFVFGG